MTLTGDGLEWFWTLSSTAAESCGPEDKKLKAYNVALLILIKY